MLKKEALKPSKLTIRHKCGECIHYEKYPYYEQVCKKLGIERHSNAPECFDENVFILQKFEPDVLNQLGLLFKDMTPAAARILTGLMLKRKTFKKYGLAFGLPVYVCLGKDFLSNYYKGYVVGVSSRRDKIVYVTSDLSRKQVSKPVMMALMPDSVFNLMQFKKKRKELVAKKRLKDPSPTFFSKHKPKVVDAVYEIPEMDKVPQSWFDAYSKKVGSNKSKIKKIGKGLEFRV